METKISIKFSHTFHVIPIDEWQLLQHSAFISVWKQWRLIVSEHNCIEKPKKTFKFAQFATCYQTRKTSLKNRLTHTVLAFANIKYDIHHKCDADFVPALGDHN